MLLKISVSFQEKTVTRLVITSSKHHNVSLSINKRSREVVRLKIDIIKIDTIKISQQRGTKYPKNTFSTNSP